MPKQVMISASSEDRGDAEQICQLLEQQGIDCWIAPRDVVPGRDYGEQIIAAIEATPVMVVVLSKHANASVFVKNEVERAVANRKIVIPFRIEDVKLSKALELFISRSQWIDAWEASMADSVGKLATAIRTTRSDQGTETIPGPEPILPLSPPRKRTWAVAGLALFALLLCSALLYALASYRWMEQTHVAATPTVERAATNTIAVMEFENQRSDDTKNNWYCKALQTAFNTELNKIPQVPVIAPEIIQRAAREAGLDRMRAAQQLGVSQFITGSFAVVGSTIRIDAWIVETATGIQKASENVVGSESEFFDLQKKLALATLNHLNVELTEAQAASLNKPTNAPPDKYRMFLGAAGVKGVAPAGDPSAPNPNSGLRTTDTPQSPTAAGLWGVAYAQVQTTTAEVEVKQVLEEYRRAHEEGNLQQLASLYVSFPESQRKAVQTYLRNVADLHVQFTDVKIEPRGRDVAVSYTRRDNFVDKETGERISLEVRMTQFLVQQDGKWKFAEEG